MRLNARIGVVHIGSDLVSVALVKTGGKLPVVLGFQSERILGALPDIEPAELQAQAVKKAAEPFAAQAEAWVLCVDSAWSVARHLTIPFRGRSRVAPAVPFELEPHLAFPIEDVAVDFIVTAERPGETDVLAVAVQRRILESQLSVCSAAGLSIDGAGLDVVGVAGLFEECGPAAAKPRLLLNVCHSNAAIVVLERRKLTQLAMLPIDMDQIQRQPEEAWRSVGNAVRSLEGFGRAPDTPIVLHVWGYCPPGGQDTSYSLPGQVELEFVGPFIPAGAAESAEDGRMRDVLAGCALNASGGNYSFDFLKDGIAEGRRSPRLVRLRGAAGALAAALLIAFVGFRYVEYRRNLERVELLGGEIFGVFAETFPNRPEALARPGGDLGGFKSFESMQTAATEEDESRAAFSPEVFQRPTLLSILMDLSSRFPSKAITITDMQVTTGRSNELTVYGEAASADVLNLMLKNLRESELLELDERRLTRSSARGKETFELVARF